MREARCVEHVVSDGFGPSSGWAVVLDERPWRTSDRYALYTHTARETKPKVEFFSGLDQALRTFRMRVPTSARSN